MLQVSVLRNDTAEVKKRLALKHFKQPELVDTIIGLDDERKGLQVEFDNTQSKVNAASKEIGKFMAEGQKEAAEKLKADVAGWKAALEPLKERMNRVEKELNDTLLLLPNLPSIQVPEGRTPEDVYKEAGSTVPNTEQIGLRKLVHQLKEEHRIMIELAYFQGYTQDEIAKLTHTPLGTVKTRLRAALTQLRTMMKL